MISHLEYSIPAAGSVVNPYMEAPKIYFKNNIITMQFKRTETINGPTISTLVYWSYLKSLRQHLIGGHFLIDNMKKYESKQQRLNHNGQTTNDKTAKNIHGTVYYAKRE